MACNQQALRFYDVVEYNSPDADSPEQRKRGERLVNCCVSSALRAYIALLPLSGRHKALLL